MTKKPKGDLRAPHPVDEMVARDVAEAERWLGLWDAPWSEDERRGTGGRGR